jgi:hypothetical protein
VHGTLSWDGEDHPVLQVDGHLSPLDWLPPAFATFGATRHGASRLFRYRSWMLECALLDATDSCRRHVGECAPMPSSQLPVPPDRNQARTGRRYARARLVTVAPTAATTITTSPLNYEELAYSIFRSLGGERTSSAGNWIFLSLLVRANELLNTGRRHFVVKKQLERYARELNNLLAQPVLQAAASGKAYQTQRASG